MLHITGLRVDLVAVGLLAVSTKCHTKTDSVYLKVMNFYEGLLSMATMSI